MSIEARLQRSAGALTTLSNGRHAWTSDVAESLGSKDLAPDPHELLDSALAACTTLTLELYLRRHQLPVTALRVVVSHEESKGADGRTLYRMQRQLHIEGEVSAEDRARLLEIANRCPIHKLLNGQIEVQSSLQD